MTTKHFRKWKNLLKKKKIQKSHKIFDDDADDERGYWGKWLKQAAYMRRCGGI